jgi:cell division protein ZapA
VNKRFEEIKERTEGLSERKAAILAAFHIASEYFQLQKERDGRLAEIQKRARVLNEQIDSVVR